MNGINLGDDLVITLSPSGRIIDVASRSVTLEHVRGHWHGLTSTGSPHSGAAQPPTPSKSDGLEFYDAAGGELLLAVDQRWGADLVYSGRSVRVEELRG